MRSIRFTIRISMLVCCLGMVVGTSASGSADPDRTAGDFPLDLAPVANMGFADETAGDGKGGWTDQGPWKDMRRIDRKAEVQGGVRFKLIDPAANRGKAVLTFKGTFTRTRLETAEIKVAGKTPSRFLYLLHACGWDRSPKGTPLGLITVTFADGSSQRLEVKSGIDVADWAAPGDVDNGRVVLRTRTHSFEAGVYLSRFGLESGKGKAVASIAFRTGGKATWIIVAATLSDRVVEVKPQRLVFTADAEWKPVDLSSIRIKAGSALDLSFLQDAPAGKYGRAVVGKDGNLVFERRPGEAVRLMGFTSPLRTFFIDYLKTKSHQENLENMVKYAEAVKRQGYNLVRPFLDIRLPDWESSAPCTFNPQRLELWDKLMAELKARGVYVYLIVSSYRNGLREGRRAHFTDKHALKPGMYLGDEELRRNWRQLAQAMLDHVNPYTGLAWKDDPAIVCVEFYNEQEFGFYRIKQIPSRIRRLYDTRWNDWLKQRYGDSAGLTAAWKRSPGKWGALAVPNEGLNTNGPDGEDFARFARELAGEQFVWYEKILRGLGYRGLVTQYNLSKLIADSEIRWQYTPVVAMNCYHCHASSFSQPGSRCVQLSSAAVAAQYWRGANSTRFADRPFIISEHNHYFWNQHQREDGLIFGGYSAFQGFSGVVVHEGAVALEVKGPNDCTSVARSPIYRANEFITAFLYRRGDVDRARHRVELEISRDFMARSGNGNRAVNSEQSKLGLLTGFSIAFPGVKKPVGVPTLPAADLTLRPGQGAGICVGDMFTDVVESSTGSGFDLPRTVNVLKSKGWLPKDNLTDPRRGVYQSENGQLTLRTNESLIKVVTPYTEGVALAAGRREHLRYLTVRHTTVPATVAAIPLDRKPLNESARIVIVYATETVNTGMTVSQDRSTLYDLGRLPVLLRCGKAELTLARKAQPGARLTLYALGLDGSRREKIPVTQTGTAVTLKLDTAALAHGPTVFFELVPNNRIPGREAGRLRIDQTQYHIGMR